MGKGGKMKWSKHFLALFFAVWLPVSFAADTKLATGTYEDLQSLWLLAHAYQFGVVLEKDKDKANAYEMLYLHCLPNSYPQKSRLLKAFSGELSVEKSEGAKVLADSIAQGLNFSCPLDDKAISQGLARLNHLILPKQAYQSFKDIHAFLVVVSESQPVLEQAYQTIIKAHHSRRDRFVFGQVHVDGDINIHLDDFKGLNISEDGFFLQKLPVAEREVTISLPGYLQKSIKLSDEGYKAGFINLNHITLQKDEGNASATLVGFIQGHRLTSDNSFVALKPISDNSEKPHFIYVNRLSSGQFYKKDLAPGKYKLYLASQQQVIEKEVVLHAGEIKQLKGITIKT